MDNQVFKTLEAGGIIVQRGTIHKWCNPSNTEICCIVFVLTEAKPYLVNGEPLEEVMRHS